MDYKYKVNRKVISQLKKPMGDIYTDFKDLLPLLKDKDVYTVGDCVTYNAYQNGITPKLCIVDGKTKRHVKMDLEYFPRCINTFYCRNKRGQITKELIDEMKCALNYPPAKLIVKGEEDLAVLPLILNIPIGSVVLYGQPDVGVVYIVTDISIRAKAMDILFDM